MLKAAFITTKRTHLTALAQLLATAIPEAMLEDPKRPVLIGVRGSLRSGKKIITDFAKAALFDGVKPVFRGKRHYDEYWTGPRANGKILEIDYMDAGWTAVPEKYSVGEPRMSFSNLLPAFMKQRQHGGITLMQNSGAFSRNKAWIDIWVENKYGSIFFGRDRCSEDAPAALQEEFNRESGPAALPFPWARYVEVHVRKRDLLRAESFRAALDFLNRPSPVFGRKGQRQVAPC